MQNGRKKILFLVTQSEFGGAQRFLFEFVPRLDKARYEILVAAGEKPGDLLASLREKNIAVRPLKRLARDISLPRDIAAFFEIRALLKRERPDVLFLLSSKAGFLGSLAARSVRTPRVIYRIGGWAFNDPQPWFMRRLYIAAEKLSARWKDVIIVNSLHDAEQARHLGITPREKLATVYNGIDVPSLRFYSREEARKELGAFARYKIQDFRQSRTWLRQASSKFIGCIANNYRTKGLSYLLRAMTSVHEKYPEAKLFIVGARTGELAGCVPSELKETVFLLGQRDAAWQYLKAFDVFVLPSLKEGFPWTVLEAQASGTPVVATAVGAVPEVIQNGANGMLVKPGDANALADAIAQLLGDEKKRVELAARAQTTVAEKFRAETMAAETEKLL